LRRSTFREPKTTTVLCGDLYKKPTLLILDEAKSALDGRSERTIKTRVEGLNGTITGVITARRIATIKM
jgi:ATP-binding cassette, subfamily B, bacterial PglK